MPELPVGSEVGGVRVDAVTGRGGMGIVYRGTQLALQRTIAIKVVRDDLANSDEFRKRFTQESRIAASLDHPNIVPIYSAGEDSGQLYVTMRYVEGTDLREAIRRDGRIDPEQAAEIVRQIAAALDAAHRRGLVHRDVKPANILLGTTEDGLHAYLTDFGLSRFADSEQITRTGTVVGTLDYMAPEQLEGRTFDRRVDVYALGCVLYQALTGSVPFPRDSEHAKMWAHMTETPPRPATLAPDLPPGFDEVIRRALAKRPDERYGSAGELAAAAVAAARTGAPSAAPTTVDHPRPTAPPDDDAPLWVPARTASPTVHSGSPPTLRPTRSTPGDGGASSKPGRPDNGLRRVGQWSGPSSGPPWARPPGTPPGTGGSGGSGGYGPPSHPSAPLPAPPRRSSTTLALVLAGVLLLAGAATVAVLLNLPGTGRSSGTPTTAPPAAAVVGTPIAVGKEPRDIQSGEGYLWTANVDGTISKIDPAAGTAEQIQVGGVPVELVVAQGVVWVWNYSDAVTPVDIASGKPADPVGANGTGNITGTAAGGGFLWLSHSSSNSVSRIDLATRQATGTPTTVGAAPVNMAFGDQLLYVSNSRDRSISVLDGSTGQVQGDPIVLPEEPGDIEVQDRTIFVGTTDDVRPIDEGSFVVGEPIPLKRGSLFVAEPGGIWVVFPLDDELRWFDREGQETRGGPVDGVGEGAGDLTLHDGAVWISDTADSTVVQVRPGG